MGPNRVAPFLWRHHGAKSLDVLFYSLDDLGMDIRAHETLVELQALVEGGLASYHPSVQLVYLALWVRSRIDPRIHGAPSDGTCSVTQEALSRDLGLGRRTVQRALHALEVHGLIQAIAAGGGRCPAVYRLLLPEGVRQAIRQRTVEAAPGVNGGDLAEATEESWLDRLNKEDRLLLETLIERLSESERGEIEREARERIMAGGREPTVERVAGETARLVTMRYFGPERLRKYDVSQ